MTSMNADKLNELFAAHTVAARVTHTEQGPAVTTYDVELHPGTRPEDVLRLRRTIAYHAATDKITVHAPVEGRPRVGVEIPVPDDQRRTVTPADVPVTGGPLVIPLGLSTTNQPVTVDLETMPHLLAAGETGSGKTNYLKTVINTLLERNTPDTVRLVLIDPKGTEFRQYNPVGHLLTPVVTTPHDAVAALYALCAEMDDRYARFQTLSPTIHNITDYHATGQRMPYIVCVVDELADLITTAGKTVTHAIQRLGQKARAAGIHLILGTQYPKATIINTAITANLPARIAFRTTTRTQSRVILEHGGAEQLLGTGDAIYKHGTQLTRTQTPLATHEHTTQVIHNATPQPTQRAETPPPNEDTTPTATEPHEATQPQQQAPQPHATPTRQPSATHRHPQRHRTTTLWLLVIIAALVAALIHQHHTTTPAPPPAPTAEQQAFPTLTPLDRPEDGPPQADPIPPGKLQPNTGSAPKAPHARIHAPHVPGGNGNINWPNHLPRRRI